MGTECELPRIVEGFAELCADAPRGTRTRRSSTSSCRTTSTCNDVDTALAVVEGADAPNGGLAFDTWHLGKLRLEPDELRRIPPRFLGWVELSDGPYEYARTRSTR